MAIPSTAPAGATEPIRVIWREVAERWGSQVSSAGVFCCKRIGNACGNVSGSATFSQHAWGNAWDITGPTSVLNVVAGFLRSAAMRPYVAQVFWQVPGHYGHIHVSGRPMFTGVPPCAGGQFVTAEEEHRLIVAPLQPAREMVAGETWAPSARAAGRHLVRASSKLARYADAVSELLKGV